MKSKESSQSVERIILKWIDVAVLVWLLLIFVLAWHALETYALDGGSAKEFHVGLQFFTSNWPNWDGVFVRQSWPFACVVLFRILLAWGPLTGVILIFWRLKKQVNTMKYRDILKYRDRAIELRLLNLVDQHARESIRPLIHEAIQKAAKDWENEYVPSLLGESGTKEWQKLSDTTIEAY